MAGNYIDKWNANGQMYDIQDAGRGLPNGVATLDPDGRVPYSQLPESAVEFKGYWNASTNTPTLADGTGTKGDMYYVDVAGTRDLGSGTQRFYVGDRVLYDGSVWKNMNPDLIDLFLPVGHLIWTSNANFNPNTQYPGTTWTQIKDRFVLAAGDTYTNGDTGGSATVTLTKDQLPSHSHTGKTDDGGVDHSHNMQHVHYYSASAETYGWGVGIGSTLRDYGAAIYGGQGNNGTYTNGGVSVSGYTSDIRDKDYQGVIYNTGGASAYLHKHDFTTDPIGQNEAHNNMPPYIVKYCWERTA